MFKTFLGGLVSQPRKEAEPAKHQKFQGSALGECA